VLIVGVNSLDLLNFGNRNDLTVKFDLGPGIFLSFSLKPKLCNRICALDGGTRVERCYTKWTLLEDEDVVIRCITGMYKDL